MILEVTSDPGRSVIQGEKALPEEQARSTQQQQVVKLLDVSLFTFYGCISRDVTGSVYFNQLLSPKLEFLSMAFASFIVKALKGVIQLTLFACMKHVYSSKQILSIWFIAHCSVLLQKLQKTNSKYDSEFKCYLHRISKD